MSKEKSASSMSLLQGLFQVGLYKSSQGRITRQVTFAALALTFALCAWRLHLTMRVSNSLGAWLDWSAGGQAAAWLQPAFAYGVPALVLVAGVWFSYRVVNLPRFADFLVAVEAEMNKVSWPSRTELFRSSIVVIFVIFALAFVLFGYDLLWKFLFKNVLGILR